MPIKKGALLHGQNGPVAATSGHRHLLLNHSELPADARARAHGEGDEREPAPGSLGGGSTMRIRPLSSPEADQRMGNMRFLPTPW